MPEGFNRDMFHDYVVAHGYGPPCEEGYQLGQQLFLPDADYAEAAFEVVFRGLTIEPDEDAIR
jgi:hypothetical protein